MDRKCSFCDILFTPPILHDKTPFSHPTEYCSRKCYDEFKKESLCRLACRKKHRCILSLIPHRDLSKVRALCSVCGNSVHMRFVPAEQALKMLAAQAEANVAKSLLASSLLYSTPFILKLLEKNDCVLDKRFVYHTWAFRACCNLNSMFCWPPAHVHLQMPWLNLPDKFESDAHKKKCVRQALPQWQFDPVMPYVTITSDNRYMATRFSRYHLIEGLRQTLNRMRIWQKEAEQIVEGITTYERKHQASEIVTYMLPVEHLHLIACVYIDR